MYRKQFLLAKISPDDENLSLTDKFEEYQLYLGSDSEYTVLEDSQNKIGLIGNLYDWQNPEDANKKILHRLLKSNSLDQLLQKLNDYAGEFVMILRTSKDLVILNDATAQKEVYFETNFECFGTQPKLLEKVVCLKDYESKEAKSFYKSKEFERRQIFIGDQTHKSNVRHLRANHYLSIRKKEMIRFFPKACIPQLTPQKVATIVSKRLKGTLVSIGMRKKLKLGITGGYDSRVLLMGSLGIECSYYVSKYGYMHNKHFDLVIPEKLTGLLKINYKVEDGLAYSCNKDNFNYLNDIEFPSFVRVNKNENDTVYINGNVSEVARNYYGYLNNAKASDLSVLTGYSPCAVTIACYQDWLNNQSLFKKMGYHYLDLFYWEERMGNWGAKARSEYYALNRDIVSPFNSRGLLSLLLSTKRKHRDSHFNTLYQEILWELSGHDKSIQKVPINPSKKQTIIKTMKRLKLYNPYKFLQVKLRL
ncbi:hypothetical protein [Crocinitomix algicola]|uniref:hypothetical protein n=1 Tax=Crocinitomix algicola TaxID=1740263 RepID=UPI0008358ABB|nr:hypothetical protein [Crocinitomix algicola]